MLTEIIGSAAAKIDVLICPPAVYIAPAAWQSRAGPVLIGAQDCSPNGADAARTGEVSAAMLADASERFVGIARWVNHDESLPLLSRPCERPV